MQWSIIDKYKKYSDEFKCVSFSISKSSSHYSLRNINKYERDRPLLSERWYELLVKVWAFVTFLFWKVIESVGPSIRKVKIISAIAAQTVCSHLIFWQRTVLHLWNSFHVRVKHKGCILLKFHHPWCILGLVSACCIKGKSLQENFADMG